MPRKPRRKRPADPTRAVAYLRVSTDEQALSPEAQREGVDRWARHNGVTVVAWHLDAVSGGTPIDQRPGLLAALDDLGAHNAGHLVIYRRDRLARDLLVSAMAEALVGRHGAVITNATNGAENGNTPEAALMRAVIDAFGAYERALIRSRTKAALDVKRRRGERTGSIPWGSQLAVDGVTLEPNAGEQAVITEARQLAASGVSQRAIRDVLVAHGVVSRGGKPLALSQVQRMLAA